MDRTIKNNIAICLLLTLMTAAIYWGIAGNEFIDYDDRQYVTENRHVASGLSLENVTWAFTTVHAANWHPITWLSHMADVEFFGQDPKGHHLVNLLFHCANGSLLFLFLTRITGAFWRSFLVAALFAVHPLHVESVAWVAERKDVLSTFFGMLALLAYEYHVRRAGRWYYAALCGCFMLSLMSKPMLVTLPFVMLLLDYWPLRRFGTARGEHSEEEPGCERLPFNKLLTEKLPLFFLSALSSCVTLYAQGKGEAIHALEITPLSLRISNSLVAYVRYLGKMIWPRDLAVIYPLPQTIPLVESAAAGALLLAISYGVYAARRHRYFLAGWLWFLGTLVPVIGLVQVGLQAMADRYTYFPLIGVFIMIVWGISDLSSRFASARLPLAIAAAALLVLYGAVTWKTVGYWKNSSELFTHAIEVTPDNYYAHYMLGKSLYEEGNFREALSHYNLALQLNPRFADTYVNIGIIYAKEGNLAEAISSFTTALSLKPSSPYVHYNLAVALQKQGRLEEATIHYREVLRLDPEHVGAHFNLGIALMDAKRWDEAISHFSEALRLKPDLEDARRNLQICFQQKGN